VISQTVLVAPETFDEGLDAARVAAAIARGLQAGNPALEVDLCPLETVARRDLPSDTRLRAARAVVVGAGCLDERTLLGSATFELATRARQSGVPAYAVAASNGLDLFDARILDLQVILEAGNSRALRREGEKLAELV
jgi:glycerate 2-kinase